MKLTLNISPCPNDTFMFDALANGRVDAEGIEFSISLADIEELNRAAVNGFADVTKISAAALPAVIGHYRVLDCGAALGRGNGPLLVAAEEGVTRRPGAAGLGGAEAARMQSGDGGAVSGEGRNATAGGCDYLPPGCSMAVPGIHTTANLLAARYYPQARRQPVLFSEIAERVAAGEFDCGVLIHEGRFTYAEKGLALVADLGAKWEQESGTPLPLGLIAVSRRLSPEAQRSVERAVRRSVEYAMGHPDASRGFVRQHAQEMDEGVMRQHIELFVNRYSVSLGRDGRAAVERLTGLRAADIFVGAER